jgi:hypothetical protein
MTENETAGTAVEQQVAQAALARMQDAKPWKLDDLAKILAGPAPEIAKDAPFPAPAAKVKMTDGLRRALKALPAVFGSVQPTEHRRLEKAEIESLTEEILTIQAVKAELASREEAIKEAVRHHIDFVAAEHLPEGAELLRAAEGVSKGHVIAATAGNPFKIDVQGAQDPWEQRYVQGKPSVSGSKIPGLRKEGALTHKEGLALTREARVFDENKLAEFIRKHPERGVEILRLLTTMGAPSASLYPPKK